MISAIADNGSSRFKIYEQSFFLPPYAPEYNPTEYLNNALKHKVHTGESLKTKNL